MCPERTLISLVGAAGFEPTTCSTQNCRATRLRYTPMNGSPRRYTLGKQPARLSNKAFDRPTPALSPLEQGMGHTIARGNSIFLGGPADHFQHAFRQPSRRDDLGR